VPPETEREPASLPTPLFCGRNFAEGDQKISKRMMISRIKPPRLIYMVHLLE